MLNGQQLMMHFILLNGINFPANAVIFNVSLIKVMTFDVMPSDLLDELMYPDLSESTPFSQKYEQNGYESKLLIRTAPTIILHLILLLLMVLVLGMCHNCQWKCIQKLRNSLFWNSWIRLLLETYF